MRGTTLVSSKSIILKKKLYEFYINSPNKNTQMYKHKNNYISTTKYNIITFLPKSLLYQFSKLPNIYFLLIAIIQSIKLISPLKPLAAILPLILVLSISLLRELIEDISRYKYDRRNNNRKVLILREGEFVTDVSSEINVGDIILVNENEEFPCDCILLNSSHNDGVCYIETGSLDGEKTLKTKTCNKEIKDDYFSKTQLDIQYKNFIGKCQCDLPNPELYKFNGKMSFIFKRIPKGYKYSISQDYDIDNLKYFLSNDQLLLKGAILRQTKQIAGICVYAGSDNKILLNSKKPRMKVSQIEILMNKLLIFIFFIQIFLCLICATMHSKFESSKKDFLINFIFPKNRKIKNETFLSFFTYLLLLNTMIPISLIVTLEIIKVIQGYFISNDILLYSKIRKKFCNPNTVSIIEELGKINYVFSDKTGTLTCNKMKFKYCVIGNLCFEYNQNGEENIDINKTITRDNQTYKKNKYNNSKLSSIKEYEDKIKRYNISERDGKKNINSQFNIDLSHQLNLNFSYNPTNPFSSRNSCLESVTNKSKNYFINSINNSNTNENDNSNYMTKNDIQNIIKIGYNFMYEEINNKNPNRKFLKEELELMNEFWFALSIGNECIPTYNDTNGNLEYNGVSPDDIEFVYTASQQGFCLLPSSNDIKKVKYGDSELDFQILNLINFSSERKRMSIIVNTPENQIKIYIKGADSEILKRLSKNCNKKYINTAIKYSDYFCRKGYRTLFVAYKFLGRKEYRNFSSKLKECELDLDKKEKLVNECIEEIEQNFFLLGVTVVEDKLQDKVPETIQDLRNSGIKIWMLTGDKIDTAENIALSCNLISQENRNFKIQITDTPWTEISKFFLEYGKFSNIQISLGDGFESESYSYSLEQNLKFSLIIDSSMLSYIFSKKTLTKKFLKIAIFAESVVCCRVSPLQKSQVVKELKNIDKHFITLAIGDGGNDVSMILEAHVGIGIYGEEGMLAVQSSDFSIGEFKYLRRLLFFHGRNSINRTGEMTLYFFFKNFVFTILQFYYMFYNIASGQSLIDDWFITCYNLVFTALPLGVQALTNFDVLDNDYEIGNKLMPLLYKESNLKSIFSVFSFFIVLVKAIIFSLINYFFTIISFKESSIGSYGIYGDIWSLSLLMYTNIIFIVSFSLIIKQLYFVWIFPFVLFLSSWITYFCFCSVVQYSLFFNSVAIIFPTFQSGKFWINLIFVCGICFLIDFLCHSYAILFSYNLRNECILYRKYKNRTDTLLECSKIIKYAYDFINSNIIKSECTLKDDSNKESEINLKSSIMMGSEMNFQKNDFKNLKEEEEHYFDNSNQILKNYNDNKMLKALNSKEKLSLSTNNSPSFNRGEKLNFNVQNKNYYKGIIQVPEEKSDSNNMNDNDKNLNTNIIKIHSKI